MFEFQIHANKPTPRLYGVIGQALLIAQLWLFVLCLPPFQTGLWYQSEPVMSGIFILAVLNSLWLIVGLTRGWLAPQNKHPIWLALGLWIVWQLLVTLWADSSWRSWFGPPEIGEGTARSIALWLLVMLACTLWQSLASRRIIIIAAIASLLVQCVLHWLDTSGPERNYSVGTWVPAKFPSYLAFMAGSVWIALMSSGFITKRRYYLLLVCFTMAVIWISLNKSAMLLLSAAIFTSCLAAFVSSTPAGARLLEVRRKWRLAAISACLAPLLFVAFCAGYGGMVGTNPNSTGIEGLFTKDNGLGSRVVLNQVAIATMQHEPGRWLLGAGWGRFTDDVFKYALVDGVYSYRGGKRDPNWSGLEGEAFHSHSQPLEVLLSLGIVGLVLWFAIPSALLLRLEKSYFWSCSPMLVAMVILSYFWFELPQCLAFDALLLASLLHVSDSKKSQRSTRRLMVPCIAVFAVMMSWSAWQQTLSMRYSASLVAAIPDQPYEHYTLEWLTGDIAHGGDALHSMSVLYGAKLQSLNAIDANHRGWYALLMNAASVAANTPSASARLASTELWLQYKLLIDYGSFRSFAQLGHQAALSITDSVLLMTKIAPLRDDYATFYLLNLAGITHNDTTKQEEILRKLLNVAPNHRAALWVLGKLLGNEEGHAMMAKAAKLGVDKVYPVTQAEIEAIVKPQR